MAVLLYHRRSFAGCRGECAVATGRRRGLRPVARLTGRIVIDRSATHRKDCLSRCFSGGQGLLLGYLLKPVVLGVLYVYHVDDGILIGAVDEIVLIAAFPGFHMVADEVLYV